MEYLQKLGPNTANIVLEFYQELGFPNEYIRQLTPYVVVDKQGIVTDRKGKPITVALSHKDVHLALANNEYMGIVNDPEIEIKNLKM